MIDPRSVAVFGGGELIGDAMAKIPFIRAIRRLWPNASLTWITNGPTHVQTSLAPMMPGLIDEFIVDVPIGLSPGEFLRPCPVSKRFDLVIDTQETWWATLSVRRIPHGRFVALGASYLFSDAKPVWGRRNPLHLMDRLSTVLETAAGRVPEWESPRVSLPTPPAARREAEASLPDGPAYVALAVGAGGERKRWPLERFVVVARTQVERGRVPVFILGPGEIDLRDELAAAVPGALFPLQAEGVSEPRHTPIRTIALARRCVVALANDSGVSRLFAVADVPLLTLFGPTDGDKIHPRVTRGAYLKARDFGGPEMDGLPTEPVLAALEELVSEPVDGPAPRR